VIYPGEKEFIFSIFDDTDVATLENIRPIYEYLTELGILTTKSVWPLKWDGEYSDCKGSHTLKDKAYADYVKELANRGFEIAFHGASMESSERERTRESLELFKETVGYYPKTYACHANNLDNLYWGANRFTFPLFRKIYAIFERKHLRSQGEKETSPYFWGDLCAKYIRFVRSFTFPVINLARVGATLPYRVRQFKYCRYFFFTCEANNVEEFNALLSPRKQGALERERGISIITTHFGKGFVKQGKLHPKTKKLLKHLSSKNGWFVPVNVLLEYLLTQNSRFTMRPLELFTLESKWLAYTIKRKIMSKSYEKTELLYLKDDEASSSH